MIQFSLGEEMAQAKVTLREIKKRIKFCWKSFVLPWLPKPRKPVAKLRKVIDSCDINAIKADRMRRAIEREIEDDS